MNSTQHTAVPLGGCTTTHHFKPPIKLPRTSEEWEEADYLPSTVTPLVLQPIMAEEENECLCTAVYDILSAHFGTRPPIHSKKLPQSRLRHHDKALKEVNHLKNEARQVLRRAKSECANGYITQPLLPSSFPSFDSTANSKKPHPENSITRKQKLSERNASTILGVLQRSSLTKVLPRG